jgi:hypothetical protein
MKERNLPNMKIAGENYKSVLIRYILLYKKEKEKKGNEIKEVPLRQLLSHICIKLDT